MEAYDLRFSDANAGAGSQALGLQIPHTLKSGQTITVELTDAEADHFRRDEAYTLSIPKAHRGIQAEEEGQEGRQGELNVRHLE